MKTGTQSISELLAAAALAEMEGPEKIGITNKIKAFAERIEERFIEVAFAEAADYADYENIERSDLWEGLKAPARPEECQFGDNASCFTEG